MIILSEYEQELLSNKEAYYWKVKARAFRELYRAKCEELRSILGPAYTGGYLAGLILKNLRASMRRQGD